MVWGVHTTYHTKDGSRFVGGTVYPIVEIEHFTLLRVIRRGGH